ncbi:MAG: hypothetical protein RIT45_3549 [Pseudomonadota bacterium]|jgi:thiol-disulfide isomerase/thioredoxin
MRNPPNRRVFLQTLGAAAAGVATLAGGHGIETAFAADAGKAAPALAGRALDGKAFDLAAAKGKVVLVDFWATWCEPCKVSLPRYVALQKKYAERGLEIVAVSVDEEAENLRRFVREKGVALTVLHDAGGKFAERWEPPKMPTAYLVGKDGKITWVHAGFAEGDEAKVEAAIVRALGPSP